MIIISDTHIAAQRQAGTTPMSQIALKQFIQAEFEALVEGANSQLIINGDLFDGFNVDPGEVIKVYEVLSKHVANGAFLTLIMGNHDASAKGEKTSSFHLLSHILSAQWPAQVQVVDHTSGLTGVTTNVWAISHCLNQSLFDLEVEKAVAADEVGILLLHCNVMSPFAEHADHSLNLSEQQLDDLIDAGWQVIVGHEHQHRALKGGKCLIPGNQIITSISDCLHNKTDAKYYVEVVGNVVSLVKWRDMRELYVEVNWQDIALADLDHAKFIRVTGDCTAEQAADMVGVVSKLRQRSSAYVLGNAVKVEGVSQMESLTSLSTENLARFDVMAALLEELSPEEGDVVKGLLQ